MNNLKIAFVSILILSSLAGNRVTAQVKLEDVLGQFDLGTLINKDGFIRIDKGFSPRFFLGNYQINSVSVLGERMKGVRILGRILDKKGIPQIMGMYRTYKTGLAVFKTLATTGTVVTALGVVKGLGSNNNFNNNTVKGMLYPAVSSVLVGIIAKVVTKRASYRAVDIFNGAAHKALKNIFSVKPASSNYGVGIYAQL